MGVGQTNGGLGVYEQCCGLPGGGPCPAFGVKRIINPCDWPVARVGLKCTQLPVRLMVELAGLEIHDVKRPGQPDQIKQVSVRLLFPAGCPDKLKSILK